MLCSFSAKRCFAAAATFCGSRIEGIIDPQNRGGLGPYGRHIYVGQNWQPFLIHKIGWFWGWEGGLRGLGLGGRSCLLNLGGGCWELFAYSPLIWGGGLGGLGEDF